MQGRRSAWSPSSASHCKHSRETGSQKIRVQTCQRHHARVRPALNSKHHFPPESIGCPPLHVQPMRLHRAPNKRPLRLRAHFPQPLHNTRQGASPTGMDWDRKGHGAPLEWHCRANQPGQMSNSLRHRKERKAMQTDPDFDLVGSIEQHRLMFFDNFIGFPLVLRIQTAKQSDDARLIHHFQHT